MCQLHTCVTVWFLFIHDWPSKKSQPWVCFKTEGEKYWYLSLHLKRGNRIGQDTFWLARCRHTQRAVLGLAMVCLSRRALAQVVEFSLDTAQLHRLKLVSDQLPYALDKQLSMSQPQHRTHSFSKTETEPCVGFDLAPWIQHILGPSLLNPVGYCLSFKKTTTTKVWSKQITDTIAFCFVSSSFCQWGGFFQN